MASLANRCSLSNVLLDRNSCGPSSDHSYKPRSCSIVIRGGMATRPRGKRVNSQSLAVAGTKSVEAPVRRRMGAADRSGSGSAAEAFEKMDGWMNDSVTEIVKNLRQAPLLVHVYGGDDDANEKPRLETEKRVEEEKWDAIKERWGDGAAPLPEGVIFVEELKDEDGEAVNGDGDSARPTGDGITRAWGLVVQGKGEECGPACYLLKTSRVSVGSGCGLGMGMGMGCTHFCLVRVKSFMETAQSQLKNSWLLQAQLQGKGR